MHADYNFALPATLSQIISQGQGSNCVTGIIKRASLRNLVHSVLVDSPAERRPSYLNVLFSQNPRKDTAHIFSHNSTAHPDQATLEGCSEGYRRQNSNEICLTCKAGFQKTDVSRLGLWRAYHYIHEHNTPAVLSRDMVSINYQRLIKIVKRFFLEKIVFGAPIY